MLSLLNRNVLSSDLRNNTLTLSLHRLTTGNIKPHTRTVCCRQRQHLSQGCKRRELLQLVATTTTLSLLTWPPQAAWAGDDQRLPISDLKDMVLNDFVQNQYYVTGKLSPEVYTTDCLFRDPTTTVKGVRPYTAAVAKLFDPARSKADLISLKVMGPDTLVLRWRLAATLNVPGSPAIKPYTGTTKYVTNKIGLICQHLEEWDISAFDAFVSVLFPNFGAPPALPISELIARA